MEGRVAWLRDRLTAGLGVNPDAFDRLLQGDNARNLVAVLLDGQIDDGDALPTLLFYTSQLEETAARLLAGKVVAPAPSDATATSPPSDDTAADATTGEGEAEAVDEEGEADAVDEASASAAGEEEASAKAEAGAAEPDGETQPSDDANEFTADEIALAPPLPPQTPPPPPPPPPPPLEPAELLQLHVCEPADLPEGAYEGGVAYFARVSVEPVPSAGGDEAAAEAISLAFDWGVLKGGPLPTLAALVSEVYAPLLGGSNARSAGDGDDSYDPDGAGSSGEFVSNLDKFGMQVSHAIQLLQGDVRLHVPQAAGLTRPRRTHDTPTTRLHHHTTHACDTSTTRPYDVPLTRA